MSARPRSSGTGRPTAPRRDFATRADYQHIITAIRSQLGGAAFAAAWADGEALTLEQAIAYVLEGSAVDAEQPAPALVTATRSG